MSEKRIEYICFHCGAKEKRRVSSGEPSAGICSKSNSGSSHLWVQSSILDFQFRMRLRKSPESMNAGDMYYVGQCYAVQENSPNSLARAVFWYQKAADARHAAAMVALGDSYLSGRGIAQDKEQAFHWYQEAAKLGNKEAQLLLAYAYEQGECVVQDREKAMNLYRNIAKETVFAPCFAIGGWDKSGLWDGFITDVMKETDASTAYGMSQRGYAYEKGIAGVEKDIKQAIAWYQKAAEAGDPYAMLILGDAHAIGEYVEKDEEKAMALYRKAAEAGSQSWKEFR